MSSGPVPRRIDAGIAAFEARSTVVAPRRSPEVRPIVPPLPEPRRAPRSLGKRKIAIIGGPAGSPGGGVWTVAENHAAALESRGHDVTLIGGYVGERPVVGRGDIVKLHEVVPGAGLVFPWGFRFVARAWRAVRPADLVHVHLCRDFMTCLAVLLTPRGTPVVAQTHGMLPPARNLLHRVFDRVVMRRVLRRVDLFLALTEQERVDLRSAGVTAPVESIKNGLDAPESTWEDPCEVVGAFLGRLHPRKQPLVFAEAAVASGEDVTWLVAGDDQGSLSPLTEYVGGATARFEIRCGMPRAEVLATLAKVSFFVLPSLDEPYPMAALEALAVGTPMILTEQSGISEIVREAEAALVVKPDVESVAAAMKRLACDGSLRASLSANARSLHAREWSLETVGDRLEEEYLEVL